MAAHIVINVYDIDTYCTPDMLERGYSLAPPALPNLNILSRLINFFYKKNVSH